MPIYTPTAQSVQDRITRHADAFEARFTQYFERLRQGFDHPAESLFTPRALDLVQDLALAGGKRQRATFVYEAARLTGSATEPAAHVGALAIELLQTSLLIHDDLVDNSHTRRGIRSTHGTYRAELPHHPQHAMGLTVMAGDLAGYLAIDVILTSGLPDALITLLARTLSLAATATFCGQIIDLERDFSKLPGLAFLDTVSDYKSGRYSAIAPMRLGLLAAGTDPITHQDTLQAYSRAIGISGQMRDDYISFFGDPKITGKPDSVDVRAGRISYPLRQTLAAATARERDFVRTVLGRADATDADVDMVREIATHHRVDQALRKMMQDWGEKACAEAATWRTLGWADDAVTFFEQMPVWGVERVL
ncbi:polyprenyl synthetase family protein [Kitasatospora sp. NPDC059327]|uniref:polyprenyl synthetase family protein n=1 Tax=Kitasatospora sp. NPDC059327 TaxID=3346803 RepID=UPI0036928BA6